MNAIDGTSEKDAAYDAGYDAGYDTGYDDGYDEGEILGRTNMHAELRGKLFEIFLKKPAKADWKKIFEAFDGNGDGKDGKNDGNRS